MRTVKTASDATGRTDRALLPAGSRDIEHIGSAHDEAELEVLKAAARHCLVAGQDELDLGLERTEAAGRGAGGGPLPVTSSRMVHLWEALPHACDDQGCGRVACRDVVFRQLVLVRIIEPTSKLDSLGVLEETGVSAPSYRTLRRLPVYAKDSWRQQLAAACAAHASPRPSEPSALRRQHVVMPTSA